MIPGAKVVIIVEYAKKNIEKYINYSLSLGKMPSKNHES